MRFADDVGRPIAPAGTSLSPGRGPAFARQSTTSTTFLHPAALPQCKGRKCNCRPLFLSVGRCRPTRKPTYVIADQCPRPLYTLDGGARELTTWMRRVVTPSDCRGRRRRSRRGNAQNLFALRGASMVGGRNGLPRRPMSRHDKRFEIRKQKAEINSGDGGRVVDGDEPADATDMVGAEVIRDRMPSLPQRRTSSDVRGRIRPRVALWVSESKRRVDVEKHDFRLVSAVLVRHPRREGARE